MASPNTLGHSPKARFDLTDLWTVDRAIADDMLLAAAFIAANHEYPNLWPQGRVRSSGGTLAAAPACRVGLISVSLPGTTYACAPPTSLNSSQRAPGPMSASPSHKA